MPKYITQLAQANTFSQTAENGQGAFSATRAWKVILNSPNEAIDINAITGVNIGTPYSNTNPIPCVSIEGRADGESRLVRIITATYRATPGADPAVDPKTLEPTIRPALYSMSTSLQEIAAWSGKLVSGGSSGSWVAATNPVGDLYDGISRLEPVVTINIDQYSYTDQSNLLGYAGYVNSAPFTFSGLSIALHCCMLQGITSSPVVEQFGQSTFRGFKVSFSFGVRAHWTFTRDGAQAIGWDMAIPQTGFNIINSGLGNSGVEQAALTLEHENLKVKSPLQIAANAPNKARAMVAIPSGDGGWAQRVASQPVALNDNGTPRSPTASPPVLINRVCLQPEMAFGNNFSNFGIRMIG